VLRAVATDGHRLALAETEAPKGADKLKGVIVPRKAVAEVRRLLDDAPEIITVEALDSQIVFRVGEAVLTSKLIDGSFPDYQRVIPKDNTRILTIDTKLFKDAVDRVATVSAERSRSVKLSISAGKLTLAVTHSESGNGVEDVEAMMPTPKPWRSASTPNTCSMSLARSKATRRVSSSTMQPRPRAFSTPRTKARSTS